MSNNIILFLMMHTRNNRKTLQRYVEMHKQEYDVHLCSSTHNIEYDE